MNKFPSILMLICKKIRIFAAQRGIFARNWVMSHIKKTVYEEDEIYNKDWMQPPEP